MDTEYLTDTSAVIKYLNGTFPKAGLAFLDMVVDAGCVLSFVSEIELLAWNPPKKADLLIYSEFVQGSTIIGIDKRVVRKTIEIRKAFGLKLPDALIAATAMTYDRTLVADNDRDFLKVDGLKYMNPNSI
ncbi:MAG: type II toxin-antitoxin system VapC family toxin [Flavobacteriales bacterium]|nr:type II toxin-antitoxin system VapC family toxin [Flavobacteriales bacterium]